jgi:hypothetical protein
MEEGDLEEEVEGTDCQLPMEGVPLGARMGWEGMDMVVERGRGTETEE